MTRRFLPPPRNERSSCTRRTSKSLKTGVKLGSVKAARPNNCPSSIRRRKGKYCIRPSSIGAITSLQLLPLTYRRKTLTLLQWSRRTKAGSPSVIWRRLKSGFPIEVVLGGPEAVARAVSFVTWHEARAAVRRQKLQRRRPKSRPRYPTKA